jgi:predicted metal-dependent hydrolase
VSTLPYRVEVVRSKRRRKTVSAHLVGDDLVRVLMPAWMSKADEERYVADLVPRVIRQERRERMDIGERAATLAKRYDLPTPKAVTWMPNRKTQWATCVVASREICVVERLADFPAWVLDYVLVHELAHLAEANHSARFWKLVNRYPKAERARGFLIAKGNDER